MAAKHFNLMWFYILVLMIRPIPVVPFTTIHHLPGFADPLPFKLETGYIEVGDVEFFYYFIESERKPTEDPLFIYMTGGPGCTTLSGLFLQYGPLEFNINEYNGSLPTFSLNPYSWTKVANIIFLEAPVGAGFSYSRTLQGSKTGDRKNAIDSYHFLRKWLQSHPKFITNPLYIMGESYAGKIIPVIAKAVSDGIDAASDAEDMGMPAMNLKGYVIGNPLTDINVDLNSRITFYHRSALISDELYESARRSCKEEYVEVDDSNIECLKDLQAISECVARINEMHLSEPYCPPEFPGASVRNKPKSQDEPAEFHQSKSQCSASINEEKNSEPYCLAEFPESRSSDDNQNHALETDNASSDKPDQFPQFGCRSYSGYLCTVWAKDINVQKALHVREGTVKEWVRCNFNIDYDRDIPSAISYHLHLNKRGYRALIYSGDQDIVIPYLGTVSWIKSLNLSIIDGWRPWLVNGQVGGYSTEFENNLTFVTVKGAGHTAPEYKPVECFAMIKRWISHQPL